MGMAKAQTMVTDDGKMKTDQPVTMQSIAQAAGVSIATVSRALNRKGASEGQEINQRIWVLASQMGYKRQRIRPLMPPKLDRPPGRRLTGHIALLAPEPVVRGIHGGNSPYYEMQAAVQQAVEENEFHLVLPSFVGKKPYLIPKSLRDGRVDGALLISSWDSDFANQLARIVPVVVLNACVDWPPVNSVMVDNRMVLFKAMAHLTGLGHRRIAYFGPEYPSPSSHSAECHRSFLEAVRHFQCEDNPEYYRPEPFGYNEHFQAGGRFMNRFGPLPLSARPTAIIGGIQYVNALRKEVQQRGIQVPRDLSVVGIGIDKFFAEEAVDLSITTVDIKLDECGKVAVALLMENLRRPNHMARIIRVEPELLVRQSTAAPING